MAKEELTSFPVVLHDISEKGYCIMWYHPEEDRIIGPLLAYEDVHPHVELLLVYADESSCHARLVTAYDSDNEGLVERDSSIPYDEFYSMLYEVSDIVRHGTVDNLIVDGLLEMDYRQAPIAVIDEEHNKVVYDLRPAGKRDQAQSQAADGDGRGNM